MGLVARKDLQSLLREAEGETAGLKRALGPFNLITLGIGAIIGTGIFVLTGPVAAENAGPAIVLSFVIAGIACAFAGLCYAEFASLIPIAGSAYSYSYTTLGEIVAWMIGWALVLEYAFGAATVAVGWSGYINSFLQDMGIHLPPTLTAAPGTTIVLTNGRWERLGSLTGVNVANLPHVVSHFDLIAFLGTLDGVKMGTKAQMADNLRSLDQSTSSHAWKKELKRAGAGPVEFQQLRAGVPQHTPRPGRY